MSNAQTAAALLLISSGVLLLASSRQSSGQIEAGEGDIAGLVDTRTLLDRLENAFNVINESEAEVPPDTAATNIAAFLKVLQHAEGTAGRGDPYRVCFGYGHTVQNLADHPAITGEWLGETLPDGMCAAAGFGPGCKSTAAGAYQIIKPTWRGLRDALGLADFGPASQDAAAVELIRKRGALEDVKAGRFADAVHKCRNEWASLPGNYAGQGQRSIETLQAWYANAGGAYA